MATLSVLREHLRGDLADIARISGARQWTNEYLERCLFEGLQQHNRLYTWASLPQAEEQLILILGKVKICWDAAITYAHDPKFQAGAAVREKVSNAAILMQLAKDLRAEYEAEMEMISADPDEGEVIVGTLTRVDHGTFQSLPLQAASKPQKPVLFDAEYIYDPVLGGRVHFQWNRFLGTDIAYIQVLLSRQSPVNRTNSSIIRTLYDVGGDDGAVPTYPSTVQQEAWIDYTILPTGRWHLAMAAINWNRLWSLSDSVPLDVENYLEIFCDTYVVPGLSA